MIHFEAKLLIVSVCLLFHCLVSLGQDAARADSLKNIYHSNADRRTDEMLLSSIAMYDINPDSIIKYADLLMDISESDSLMIKANMHKAAAYRLKGEYNEALESAFTAMSLANTTGHKELIWIINIAIANIYSENQNPSNASRFFQDGIDYLRKADDSLSLAKALYNAADHYLEFEELDSALMFTEESEQIFRRLNEEHFRAYSLGNLGFIYFKKGNAQLATKNIEMAISELETLGDEPAITEYLLYLVEIKIDQGEYSEAYELANESLEMAHSLGLTKEISQAHLKLSQIAEFQQDHKRSLQNYKSHVALRDSIHNLESVQEMADMRTDFEVSQKQLEVDLLNNQKRTQRIIMYSLGFFLLLSFIYYRRLSKEKDRSDLLLLNILPSRTAKELKEKGKV
jgi:hypothetical protein